MNAEIISMGTELLLGHIVDTNSAYLAKQLAVLGIDLFYLTTVGDNRTRFLESLHRSSDRAHLIFTIGGLGPTVDDITAEALSCFVGKRLVFNRNIREHIKRHFLSRKLKPPADSFRQAYIPEGARYIKNHVGTAPGLILNRKETTIIALPGPPRELISMFERSVKPYLKERYPRDRTIISRTLHTTGLPESQIHKYVRNLLAIGPNPTVGIYARPGEVDLMITAKARNKRSAYRTIAKVERTARKLLKDRIFGSDATGLEEAVGAVLLRKKKTIATAESCTGGLLASRLTDIGGSSRYFLAGVTAYSNDIKIRLLRVKKSVIKRCGAVSEQVALAMAEGVRSFAVADIGVGITGIAGPTGGTKEKPVGLVYIALSSKRRSVCRAYSFKGSRMEIKQRTAQAALDMVRGYA